MTVSWVDARKAIPEEVQGRDLSGQCAICGRFRIVRYCSKCGAVFCDECKDRYFSRGYEFVMSLLGLGSHGRIQQETVNG